MASSDMTTGANPAAAGQMSNWLDAEYDLNMPARGDVREGVVARVTPSEVLVDVGAKSEGIITGRELDSLDDSARKALAIGQKLLVYVLDPEDRNGNILLSLSRAREEQDWRDAEALLASQDV